MAIKIYFFATANRGVFLPGYLALIRDDSVCGESLIHGSSLVQNRGVVDA